MFLFEQCAKRIVLETGFVDINIKPHSLGYLSLVEDWWDTLAGNRYGDEVGGLGGVGGESAGVGEFAERELVLVYDVVLFCSWQRIHSFKERRTWLETRLPRFHSEIISFTFTFPKKKRIEFFWKPSQMMQGYRIADVQEHDVFWRAIDRKWWRSSSKGVQVSLLVSFGSAERLLIRSVLIKLNRSVDLRAVLRSNDPPRAELSIRPFPLSLSLHFAEGPAPRWTLSAASPWQLLRTETKVLLAAEFETMRLSKHKHETISGLATRYHGSARDADWLPLHTLLLLHSSGAHK